MTNIVKFNDIEIEIINQNNQNWMTCRQIADVLGMSTRNGATDLYNAHKEEFDDTMTCIVKQGRTRVRIFNRDGAWLIGMFARTEKAADFRKWVLKVLGSVADNCSVAPTVPVNAHTRRLPSGKKEIVLSDTEHKTIGGMIKKCCAVAVRSELNNVKVVEPNFTYLFPAWLCGNEFEPNLVQSEIESMINFLHEKLKGQKERDTSLYGLYRFFIAVNGLFVRYGSVRSETLFVSEMMSKNNGYNKEHLSEAIRRINEFASSAPVGYSKSYF